MAEKSATPNPACQASGEAGPPMTGWDGHWMDQPLEDEVDGWRDEADAEEDE
jgi:hypothetical protein